MHKYHLNTLLRYKRIANEVNKYNIKEIPITEIYRKYIYPKYHISKSTLNNILSIDIDFEIEQLKNN